MEEKSLDSMLHSFNNNENDTWLMNVMKLNLDCIINMRMQKAKSGLTSVAIIKIIAVVFGLLWVWLLGTLGFAAFMVGNIFFTISADAVMLITIIAIAVYIKHLVLISQIKNSDSIIYTQTKLAELQTSTLKITRILFLQMPFYSTWFITPALLSNAGTGWLAFQFLITILLAALAIWLYRNISFDNVNKKWFRVLFNSSEWTNVTKAIAFIKEIDDFKNDK
ncbi:MAG: hypothetical protein ABI861_00980 [Panacibacter sp.]